MVEVRYRRLREFATVLRFLAWLVLIGGVLLIVLQLRTMAGGIAAPVRTTPWVGGLYSLLSALYAVSGFILLYGIADMILVFLDIEANTRLTATRLAELHPPEGS